MDFGFGTIVVVIILLIAAYVVVAFNSLVKARQMMREAWSGIDVQLKRRADLIPNLVEAVKGFVGHEQKVLADVTELRSRAQGVPRDDVAGRAQVEGMLGQALGRLFAVAEAYPTLQTSENFNQLQASLATLESEIQMSRRYYNGAARALNIKVESFPSNLVARMFSFHQAEFFEIENAEDRAVPEVSFN